MKKFVLLFFGLLIFSVGWAKPVKTFEQAVDKVIISVKKNQLTTLERECLLFVESDETETYYAVDVRENHNEKCGGDPETAPRLMSYEVKKKSGKLCTDSIRWAEQLNVDDPYDFRCRPIK